MSCLGINHFNPSKKVWKNFASKLRGELQKFQRSRPIKNTTAAFASVTGRKKRFSYSHRRIVHTRRLLQRGTFAPVYIDELFSKPSEAQIKHLAKSPEVAKKEVFEKRPVKEKVATLGIGCSSGGSTNMVGKLEGVDLKAELFIAKFREDMRLERQRSFSNYQEMLARGT